MNKDYATLFTLGDVIPLGNFSVDINKFINEVSQFNPYWRQYNTSKPWINRLGLSLTSIDGNMSGIPDLESFHDQLKLTGVQYTENMFTVPTPAYKACTSLHPVFDMFNKEDICRSHVLKLNAGGFFPWHRDGCGFRDACTFRVLVPLTNSGLADPNNKNLPGFLFLSIWERIIGNNPGIR